LLFPLGLVMVACDGPTFVEPSNFTARQTAATSAIPVSYQHHYWTTHGGNRQFLTIVEPNGDHVHFAAEYDAHGRLSNLRTFRNGTLVGHDQPIWSGDQRLGHFIITADGDFVQLDHDYRLQAYGDRNGGYYPCAVGDDDDEFEITSSGGCGQQFRNYARESGGLLLVLMGAGAATTASGGLGTVVAIGMVAYHATHWYDSMRDLDRCVKGSKGSSPPIQIE